LDIPEDYKTKEVTVSSGDFAADACSCSALIQNGSGNKKRLHLHATVSVFKSRQCRFAGILNQKVQVGHS